MATTDNLTAAEKSWGYLRRLLGGERPGTEASVPSIIPNDDTARTRRNDPQTSHDAADRSQANLHATRAAVLTLVSLHKPGLTGPEINDLYELMGSRNNWPRVNRDSPRRRAGELAKDGLLAVSDVPRGTARVYTLTDAGRKAVQS